jgi:hypothetical protein
MPFSTGDGCIIRSLFYFLVVMLRYTDYAAGFVQHDDRAKVVAHAFIMIQNAKNTIMPSC